MNPKTADEKLNEKIVYVLAFIAGGAMLIWAWTISIGKTIDNSASNILIGIVSGLLGFMARRSAVPGAGTTNVTTGTIDTVQTGSPATTGETTGGTDGPVAS